MKSEQTKANMVEAQRRRCLPQQIARALKIKKLLAEGLRGTEIAAKVGCTPEFVYKIKKGERYGWLI